MCLAGWGVLMLIKPAEGADWKKGWEGGVAEEAGKQHRLECKGFACCTGHLKIFLGSYGEPLAGCSRTMAGMVFRKMPEWRIN